MSENEKDERPSGPDPSEARRAVEIKKILDLCLEGVPRAKLPARMKMSSRQVDELLSEAIERSWDQVAGTVEQVITQFLEIEGEVSGELHTLRHQRCSVCDGEGMFADGHGCTVCRGTGDGHSPTERLNIMAGALDRASDLQLIIAEVWGAKKLAETAAARLEEQLGLKTADAQARAEAEHALAQKARTALLADEARLLSFVDTALADGDLEHPQLARTLRTRILDEARATLESSGYLVLAPGQIPDDWAFRRVGVTPPTRPPKVAQPVAEPKTAAASKSYHGALEGEYREQGDFAPPPREPDEA